MCAACILLMEYPSLPQTLLSASELIVKAELALAMIDLTGNDLSVRVADNLLLEARVRMESRAAP